MNSAGNVWRAGRILGHMVKKGMLTIVSSALVIWDLLYYVERILKLPWEDFNQVENKFESPRTKKIKGLAGMHARLLTSADILNLRVVSFLFSSHHISMYISFASVRPSWGKWMKPRLCREQCGRQCSSSVHSRGLVQLQHSLTLPFSNYFNVLIVLMDLGDSNEISLDF